MADRKSIKVQTVATPRKAGQGMVLEFKGADGVLYETWDGRLTGYIKPGAELDAEVEYVEKGQYKHWRVVQLYVDGKPVVDPASISKGGGPRRGGSFGRSPETVQLEYKLKAMMEAAARTSSEGQTAIQQIGQLLTNGSFGLAGDVWSRLVSKYWQAVEKSLDRFLAADPGQLVKAMGAATPKSPEGKATEPAAPRTEAKSTESMNGGFKNAGQFLSKVAEVHLLNRTQTLAYPEVAKLFEAGEYDKAYLKVTELVAKKEHRA